MTPEEEDHELEVMGQYARAAYIAGTRASSAADDWEGASRATQLRWCRVANAVLAEHDEQFASEKAGW